MPAVRADDESDSHRIDVAVELVAADRLTITPRNGGRTVTYEPTDTNPGCDRLHRFRFSAERHSGRVSCMSPMALDGTRPGTDGGPGRRPEAGSCRGGVEGLHRGERSDPTAPQVRVVIDASELGLEAVIYAIIGVLVGVPLAGLLIAALASRLGRRRFGFGSIAMGIVVSIATLVVVVVLWRTIGGEVTGWDLLWATGLTVAAAWSLRRLALRPQASTART